MYVFKRVRYIYYHITMGDNSQGERKGTTHCQVFCLFFKKQANRQKVMLEKLSLWTPYL